MCGRHSRRNITELLAYLAAPTRYEVCTAGITYLIEEGDIPIRSWDLSGRRIEAG
jgi:hypothetical protein